jgi:hypothetical protein
MQQPQVVVGRRRRSAQGVGVMMLRVMGLGMKQPLVEVVMRQQFLVMAGMVRQRSG